MKAAALALFAAFSMNAFSQQPDPAQMTGNQFDLLLAGDTQLRAITLAALAKNLTANDTQIRSVVCWPQGSTYFQAAKVIDKYMDDYPQFLNGTMRNIVGAALMTAFPCPA